MSRTDLSSKAGACESEEGNGESLSLDSRLVYQLDIKSIHSAWAHLQPTIELLSVQAFYFSLNVLQWLQTLFKVSFKYD